MATRIAESTTYRINESSITFVENSGYGVQLIQVSASSSCYIKVYDKDNGIFLDNELNVRRWKVTAYNNKFPDGDTEAWFIYVRLERNGTSALVIYDKRDRAVNGGIITTTTDENGDETKEVGEPDPVYFYIKIGTVGATDGVSIIREITYDTGLLGADGETYAMTDILASMFIPHYDDPTNPNKLTWIEAKSHMGIQGGVTMYVDNGNLDLPSIYDGLRVDNQSIYWEEIKDEEGNVIDKVLKAKADDFKGTLGSLTNVGEWADAAATADRIMVQKKGSTTWTSLSLEELGTASFENVKESGEGNAYTSIVLSEDKKTLTLNKGESFAKQTDYEALNTKVTDFLEGSDTDNIINKWKELEKFLGGMTESDELATILSGKADKGTTLEDYGITDAYTQNQTDTLLDDKADWGTTLKDYGITDAYTKTEMDSALDDYVTIKGKEEITGEKNFTGGLKVNGSPIVYDKDNEYWKLDGDLLITGAVTMFANEGKYTPSTIMDAVQYDGKTIVRDAEGNLALNPDIELGGGVTNWDDLEGKPLWITDTKPEYKFEEIKEKPTTLDKYGITDAKIESGVITLGGNTITPLVESKANELYVTSLGTSGNNLIWTLNGEAKTITVPYASKSNKATYSTFLRDYLGNYERISDLNEPSTYTENQSAFSDSPYRIVYDAFDRSAANKPETFNNANVLLTLFKGVHTTGVGQYVSQLYFPDADVVYFRRSTSDGFKGWKKVAFTDSDITGNAATATKATQDADGNVISSTYAKGDGTNASGTWNISISGESNRVKCTEGTGDAYRPMVVTNPDATTQNLFYGTKIQGNYATGDLKMASATIDEIKIYKSKDDVLYLDGNLVVRGGVTMFGTNSASAPSILDSLPIANTSGTKGIATFDSTYFTVSNGKVSLIADSVGLNEDELAAYLTQEKYAKQSDIDTRINGLIDGAPEAYDTLKEIADVLDKNVNGVGDILEALGKKADKGTTLAEYGITDAKISDGTITLGGNTITPLTQSSGDARYVTALGTSGNDLTWTLNGLLKKITIPYATTANQLTKWKVLTIKKNTDAGTVYKLIANLSNWNTGYDGQWGMVGMMYGHRGGNMSGTTIQKIVAYCAAWSASSGGTGYELKTDITTYVKPCIVSYNGVTYLALKMAGSGSSREHSFLGYTKNLLEEFIEVAESAATLVHDTEVMSMGGVNVASSSKLATPRTIWGQSFDGTENVSGAITGATTGSFSDEVSMKSASVDGISIYKSSTGVLRIDGDVVVSGALTMFGDDSIDVSTIMDGVAVDGTTIMNDGNKLYLNPNLDLGGGLDDVNVAGAGNAVTSASLANNVLTLTKGATFLDKATGDANYVTALGTTGNYLTWTLNGEVKNITVPYSSKSGMSTYTTYLKNYLGDYNYLEDLNVPSTYPDDQFRVVYDTFKRDASNKPVTINNVNGLLTFFKGIHVSGGEQYTSQLCFPDSEAVYFRKSSNGTFSTWKKIAFTDSDITGNAGSATKLQAARTIWGQSFDGTANVSGAITGATTGSFSDEVSMKSASVDGISIYKSSTGALRIDGDVVLSGALTMFGTDSVNTSTIMDGVNVDGTTIMNDGKKLYLNPNLELGGLDEAALADYLGRNKYLTQTSGDNRYLLKTAYTASDILTKLKTVDGSGSGLDADLLDGMHSTRFPILNTYASADDLNDATRAGYYIVSESDNIPSGFYNYGMLETIEVYTGISDSEQRLVQVYYPHQATSSYKYNAIGIRFRNAGSWTAWRSIVTKDGNVASATTASKLSTASAHSAWGQTYWTSEGVPASISGDMSNVGNVTSETSKSYSLGNSSNLWKDVWAGNVKYTSSAYLGFTSSYASIRHGGSGSQLIVDSTSVRTNSTASARASLGTSSVPWAGLYSTIGSFSDEVSMKSASIDGVNIYKSSTGVLRIDGDVVVSGAVTMYGTNSVTASTIMDGILVDGSTIIKDPTTKKLMLNPDLELGGGLDETALANYLTTNKYLTQTTGDTRYVTALGINGNNLTWTKNGVVNNITVPYATTAKELTSYSAITFSKSDNSGKPCYLLIADVTSWYNVSSGATDYGVAGFVYGYRNGASPAYSMNIAARCAYGKGYYSLNSSLKSIIEPRVVSYNSKYYLALYLQRSNRTFNFIGRKDNLLSSFTELQCSDGNGTYSGLSVVYKGSATGTSSKADSLSTSRTISISGHATGSGSFDGSSDLGINVAIPTRNVYINGTGYTVHSTITTDTTGVYAPTSGGTSGYVLKANGASSVPTWVAQSSLSVGTASKLSTERAIWGQSFDGTASVSGNMTGVGSITMSGALSGATTGTFSSTLSGNEVVISNSGGTTSGHLRFSRANANYIAIPTGGTLAVNLDGSINAAGSDLIVRDGAVHPGTSGSTSLGRDGNLWNGLYLYGGSTSGAFNKFGVNFGADVARISANSSGGLGIYTIGDSSKIYLRAGCTTSGASSTGLVIDANGNVQITGNLLVQGGVTMYATSNENPNPEFYAKEIYIAGYSDGRYSKLTQGGSYIFHIPSSGTWASGWSAYDDTAGQSLGNAFGIYGSGSTLTYFYYGGTYSSPWIKLQKTAMEGTYWKLNDTSTNPYLKLVQGSDWYIQGYQGYLYLGATSSKALRISSDGSLYTPKTLTQGSDIRFKDIHKDILLSLSTMAEAPSIEFHFKDDEQKSTHIGTSAQYWQSVRGVVTEDSEGRLGMDYSSLGVVMGISLARELSRFESDTDRRIRLLEEENEELRKEIEQLKSV